MIIRGTVISLFGEYPLFSSVRSGLSALILISASWQHGQMNNIVEELGAKDIQKYPEERFDLIWTIPPPYKDITNAEISNAASQNCPGLDVERVL